jgi:hypothetical protein
MIPDDPAPATASAATKTRRWPLGLLVGVINGIVVAAAIAMIADWVMEMHHVSNMEGGRACAVIAIWMPLAFCAGFISGFVVSLVIARGGFVGYLIRQGAALAIAALVVGAVAGIGYATADHPPLLDGKNLALEIEVQAPAKGRSVEDLQAADFGVALVVSASDRSYSDMRWVDAVESNETIFVTAWAPLNSRDAGRLITVGVEGENRQIFNVALPSSPKKIEDEWSEWTPPRGRFDNSKPAPEDQYLVRYRVRYATEYSPTPAPMREWNSPAPDESAAPNESPNSDGTEAASATPGGTR